MSNYKQVTGIGIETISSDAHTNETLKAHYQSNDLVTIYFGLKDEVDEKWEWLVNGRTYEKTDESVVEFTELSVFGCGCISGNCKSHVWK